MKKRVLCKCSVIVDGLMNHDTSDGIVEGIEGGGGSHSVSEHMVNVIEACSLF